MRSRLAILLAVVAVVTALVPWGRAVASAGDRRITPAHGLTGIDMAQGKEGSGKGQGSAGAETGAGGSTEGGSSEAGPPWTYQMARLSLVLLVALVLSIGLIYYRLVARRQRGQV